MNVLYAPDSYGGFLTAPEAVAQFEEAAARSGLFVTGHPLSDGGEGLLEVLRAHGPVELHGFEVPGPDGEQVFASVARRRGVWWIESAEVIGLHLTHQSAMDNSSYGLGCLIRHVANTQPGPIVVGLGGTATMDGGIGMLQGMGFTIRDSSGRPKASPVTLRTLAEVAQVDHAAPFELPVIQVACDVRTAARNAAAEFGPQKGLSPSEVELCGPTLARIADVLCRGTRVPTSTSGGGAAGGAGLALASRVAAGLGSGARMVSKATRLDSALADADVVVVGEGRLDSSSFMGKVVDEVTRRAQRHHRPVHALVGIAQVSDPRVESVEEIGSTDRAAFERGALRLCARLSSR